MMRAAFSLVELSIVLVILGLLTGGILTGQSLIEAAELRAVTVEYTNFQTAVNTFRGKYFALPGDMRNATDFWQERTDCNADSANDPRTCDGNGDGNIEETGNIYGVTGQISGESFLFWDHLALAGMIEGDYTGHAGPGSHDDSLPGVNVPVSRYGGACYHVEDDTGGTTQRFNTTYSNPMIRLAMDIVGDDCNDPAFPPEDLWNLDTKMDDGKPGQGTIIALYWDECTNAADQDDTAADYALEDDSVVCAVIFNNSF